MTKLKYNNSIFSLGMGIVLLIMSIILFIGKGMFYKASVELIIFIFFLMVIIDLGNLAVKWKEINKNKRNGLLFKFFFHFGSCLIFVIIPNFVYGLVPMMFSIYLCLIGISQIVMCLVEVFNGDFIKFSQLFIAFVCFGIAVPVFMDPVMKLDNFTICLATYMMLLSVYYFYDFMKFIVPIKTKDRLKRRVRITLPKIVEAIIPYSVMEEINRNLDVRKTSTYSFNKIENSDLSILIHTSNRGFNRVGHMDIYFEGNVISYGNYDEGSRWFKQFFGDGVLFVTSSKVNYINFCIDNSKKTVFEFGIVLTDRQKVMIRKRIEEIMENTVSWNHKSDKRYNNGDSYAGRLYKKTKAKFYKFKKGKYRTYYVLGTNCCYLVDDILGKGGMDILSINGIITPGTYYNYLNRELKLKNSNVVSKSVYNFDNRPKTS